MTLTFLPDLALPQIRNGDNYAAGDEDEPAGGKLMVNCFLASGQR